MREEDHEKIDQMLANHDEAHGNRLEQLLRQHVQAFANEHGVQVRQGDTLIEPEERPAHRTDWPRTARHWTEADRAERQALVKELYGNQGLAIDKVAELINIPGSTVGNDVRALRIQRRAPGKGNARLERKLARQEEVRRLYQGKGYSIAETARELGAPESTISYDVLEMGIARGRPQVPDGKLIELIGRVVRQQDDLAQLLLNDPKVYALRVSEEQAKDWEKSLKRVVKGVSLVRKTMKGDQ